MQYILEIFEKERGAETRRRFGDDDARAATADFQVQTTIREVKTQFKAVQPAIARHAMDLAISAA